MEEELITQGQDSATERAEQQDARHSPDIPLSVEGMEAQCNEMTGHDSVLQLNLAGDSLQKFAKILQDKGLNTAEDAIQYFFTLHNQSSEYSATSDGRTKRARGRPKGSRNKLHSSTDQPSDLKEDANTAVEPVIIPQWDEPKAVAQSSKEKGTVIVDGVRKSTRPKKNPFTKTEFVPIPKIDNAESDASEDQDEWSQDAGAEDEDEEIDQVDGEVELPDVDAISADDSVTDVLTSELSESTGLAQNELVVVVERVEPLKPLPRRSIVYRGNKGGRRRSGKVGRPRNRPKDVMLTTEEMQTRKCSKCNQQFDRTSDLSKHKGTEHGRPGHPYFCDYCDYTAMFACDMKRHQYCHKKDKEFKCDMCDFKTNWERNVTLHMMNVHNGGREPWKCDRCDAKVYNHSKIKQHQLSHNPLAKKCGDCGLLFEKEIQLTAHMNNHKKLKQFHCTLCSYSTAFQSNLKSHIKLKHDKIREKRHSMRPKRTISCEICNKLWATHQHREVHMQIHEQENRDEEKPYYCDVCNTRSSDLNQMVRHRMIHSEDKPYQCRHCEYRTRWKKDLKTHELIHSGEKTVQCPHCSYSCYTRQRLRAHLAKHDDTRRFLCQLCSTSFKSKQALRMHIMYHTGDATFSCNQCDFRTVTEMRLKKHKLRHSEDRNFSCNLCGKRFKQPHHVTQHRDIVHLGKPSYREKKRIALQQSAAEAIGIATGEINFASQTFMEYEDGTTALVELAPSATSDHHEEPTQYVMVETPTGFQYVAVVMPDEGVRHVTAVSRSLVVDGSQVAGESSTLEDAHILLTQTDGSQLTGVYYAPASMVSAENSQAVESLVSLQP